MSLSELGRYMAVAASAVRDAIQGSPWKLLAVLFALANLKSLPFVWHLRLVRALVHQLYFQPTPLPPTALFEPIITSSHSGLLECDYNIHKSNSTYFSDLDISRTALVTAITRRAHGKIAENKRRSKSGNKASSPPPKDASSSADAEAAAAAAAASIELHAFPSVMLGGISCLFRRELKPYARFEIWTRILAWDRKWLYLVSHIVKPGTVKPARYTLQPWRKTLLSSKLRKSKTPSHEDATAAATAAAAEAEKDAAKLQGAVIATSLAKYVFKKGRLTVPPEHMLALSGMLPAKADVPVDAEVDNDTPSSSLVNNEQAEKKDKKDNDNSNNNVNTADIPLLSFRNQPYTWQAVEAERQRGMVLAQLFAGLDGLHAEFDGGEYGVLGEYA